MFVLSQNMSARKFWEQLVDDLLLMLTWFVCTSPTDLGILPILLITHRPPGGSPAYRIRTFRKLWGKEITREIANGIGSVDSWRLLQDMYRKILLGKASWQNLWIMKIHDISLCFIASSSLHRFPVLVLLCQGFWERLDYERIKYQTVVRWAANESLLWPPCSKAWQKDSCYIHSNVATTDIPPLSTISCQISTGLACHVQDKACQDAFYQEEDRGNTWQWQVEIETAQSQNENLETYVVSTRSNAKDTNHGERIECKPRKM